jgi:hypothetical protein
MPVSTKTGDNKFDIREHNVYRFKIAKIVKGIKNIFIKLLVRKKLLYICTRF